MEIDDPEYPNIGIELYSESERSDKDDRYIKQTLLHSPIFTNIFPEFQVAINKKFRGLSSSTFNDEADQYLGPKDEDSQNVFSDDDDDLLFNIGETTSKPNKESNEVVHDKVKLSSIRVIVKTTSLLVNEVEFHVNAPIRSSCIVKGIKNSSDQEEDSLLISLKSGFLLLIRMFYVPRDYKGSDYNLVNKGNNFNSFVFKPFIVQWWDTSSDLSTPSLDSSGYMLNSHSSGLSVVSASACNVLRIYNTQHTNSGIMFMPHYNVPIDGILLHSCFADPLSDRVSDNHHLFLVLVFTNFRRLEINLFGWSSSESIHQSLTKSILPLDNNFKIPIFIVSLGNNGSFLFVTEDEFVVIRIHDIMSAEYGFRRIPFEGTFPTNYYRPNTAITATNDDKTDEILISTANGVMYSFIITNNDIISINPIIRISDPISVFTLEKVDSGYSLIFGSDTGSNRELIVNELFSEEYIRSLTAQQKINYSGVSLVVDYKNWAPLLDVQIIDSFKSRTINSHSDQELWALTGVGKRTRLTQFRNGYPATRRSKTYDKLRKTDRMHFIEFDGKPYLICSLPFQTIVLEYQPFLDDAFIEIEDPLIFTDDHTLYISKFPNFEGNLIIQITENAISITNLSELSISHKFIDKRILSCDMVNDYIVVVLESYVEPSSITIELFKAGNQIDFEVNLENSGALISLHSFSVDYQASIVKFILVSGIPYLVIGNFDGFLLIYKLVSDTLLEYKQYFLYDFNPYNKKNVFNDPLIIPNDIIQISEEVPYLFVGSKDGYYIHFEFDLDLNLNCRRFLRIGETPVKFNSSFDDNNSLFIYSRSLWLLNLYDSEFPSRVYFDEKYDRSISTMIQLPNYDDKGNSGAYFGFVREEGLTVASVFPFKRSCVKQVNIAETAKKFIYLPYISTFVILCPSKEPKSRLKFIDRKLIKTLQHQELNSKFKQSEIFEDNEVPTSACIWSIKRQDRISKKLLVGSTVDGIKGTFKVLDVSKTSSQTDQSILIRVSELTSFDHKEPITNIQQVNSMIVFSSGKSIYSTSYDVDERRLKPITNLITLPSDITSLSVGSSERLLVTTKLDSIYQFIYCNDNNKETLKLAANDPSPKSLVNQAQLNSKFVAGDKLHSSILIMDTSESNLQCQLSYKMSNIPRVYSSKFNSFWVDKSDNQISDSNLNILCIGVNGEIISIRLTSNRSSELLSLTNMLNLNKKFKESLQSSINKLDGPFIDKISGKGLISINKPYFNYKDNKDNKGTILDYDLEEISKVCYSGICI